MKVNNHNFVVDCPILFIILSVRCFSIFPIEAPQSKSLAATVRNTIDRFSRKFCLGQQLFNAISASHLNTILTYLEVTGQTNPL